jgi:hypothetical protein
MVPWLQVKYKTTLVLKASEDLALEKDSSRTRTIKNNSNDDDNNESQKH